MTDKERTLFTPKDIACEAGLFLLRRGDFAGAVAIVATGMAYNWARETGDPEKIYQAYRRLHNRGKGHW